MKSFMLHVSRLLYQPANLFLTTFLLASIMLSCTKQPNDEFKQATVENLAQAPGGAKAGAEVPISLVIENTLGDVNSTACKITSDGLGAYRNGLANMRVVIDQYGNLIFDNTANQGKKAQRSINFNFDNPLSVVQAPPFTTTTWGGYMATIKSLLLESLGTPFIRLQDMTVSSTQCVVSATGVSNGDFIVNFHRGPNESEANSPTSFVTVTRTSATQWVMTPGTCNISANADVAALYNNGTGLYGYYHMPFRFTLTKL